MPPHLPASEVTLDPLQARVTDLFSGLETALAKPIFAALNDASMLSLLGPNALRTPPPRLLADLTREGKLEWVPVDGGWVVRPLDPDGLSQRSLDRAAAATFLGAVGTGLEWRSAPYLRWVGSLGERELRSPAAYALLHLLAATGKPVNEPVELGRDRAAAVVLAAVQPDADRGKAGTWEKPAGQISPSLREELRRAAIRMGGVEPGMPIALVVNDLARARLEATTRTRIHLRVIQPGQAWAQDEVGTVDTLENYGVRLAAMIRFGKITRDAAQTGVLAVEESLVGTLTVHWPNGAKMVWTLPLDRRETARAEFSELPEAVRNAITSALGEP